MMTKVSSTIDQNTGYKPCIQYNIAVVRTVQMYAKT